MIYRRKRSKLKITLVLLIPIVLLLVIFRVDLKEYVFGDKLKVLSIKESVFFIESDVKSKANLEKLPALDENKGIMIFTMANSSVNIEDITKKFSGEVLIGRIRKEAETFDGYSVDKNMIGTIAKDTKVEILTHYDSAWYYVKAIDSESASWVSEDVLSFPYTPRIKSDVLTNEEIEVYINSSDIKSSSDRLLYIDLMRQSIYVFENYSGKWNHAKTIMCISGTSRNPILKGEFKIVSKDEFVLWESEKVIYRYLSKLDNGFDIRSIPKSTIPLEKVVASDDEKEEVIRSLKGNIW
ncbi:MAG: SH3 domain-containing protein, partial [Acidaminobacteraceae bacterium]